MTYGYEVEFLKREYVSNLQSAGEEVATQEFDWNVVLSLAQANGSDILEMEPAIVIRAFD
jgi:hypothetical protein